MTGHNDYLLMGSQIATILGFAGIFLTYLKYRAEQKATRFSHLNKFFSDYLKDEMMLRIYNDIEWSSPELAQRMHNEYKLDFERFFAIFENYLHIKETQLKCNSEGFEIYEFMVKRIVANEDIRNYFLDELRTVVIEIHPYPRLNQLIVRAN